MLFLFFSISTIIGDRGTRVIFAYEAYIKVPGAAVSTFLQNEDLSPTIVRHAIKYVRLEGEGGGNS